jgi:hypothetical protein
MANPLVRPYLRFFPEDAGKRLTEAWQGQRFLREMPFDLRSPMVRVGNRDFYIYEPASLSDGRVCMPIRWFTRLSDNNSNEEKLYAEVCEMEEHKTDLVHGYIVHEYRSSEISVDRLSLSFIELKELWAILGKPNPINILGMCLILPFRSQC